ncbi:hypothetical protein M408DRAFT_16968 [Serendipita vermifera MAFF 305830]|uniref:Uncharacterized protein n=1 Tax=Serendipita vermifera MAFF 305830 TaxID=933852 RepID=A0A0C2WIU4_SERVB|nr:hypothetical protein M408DRAFT_16968 [Serendipita vermifera MAFF 305830]
MTSLSHNGFRAWIACEGTKLQTYATSTEGTIMTCWVASLPDTPFSAAWKKQTPREVASSGHVFIDGHDVASGIMRPRRKRHVERSAVKTGTNHARLEISWVKLGKPVPLVTTKVENITIAHEQAKKAGAMVTTFAVPEPIERGKAVSTTPYDRDHPGPHVVFVFRYHQMEVLQAWGVAPRPACRRSEATLDKEDDNPRDERDTGSFTCREVIDLDSDTFKREEDDKTDVDFATTSSEAESEPLYDMGDIGSIFSPTDNESKEDITRTMKIFKDEDAMSTTSDGDATCAEDKTSFAFAVPDTQEEPMEDDD